jgi:hypothetical protein
LDTESHHDFELGEAQGLSLHHLGATLPSHRFSMSVSALPASQRQAEIENICQALTPRFTKQISHYINT